MAEEVEAGDEGMCEEMGGVGGGGERWLREGEGWLDMYCRGKNGWFGGGMVRGFFVFG